MSTSDPVSYARPSTELPLRRRGFVSALGAVSAGLAALWVPTRAGGQRRDSLDDRDRGVSGRGPLVRHEQDRWLDALTGVHRQVYDIVTPAGALGIAFARNFLTANNEGYAIADKDLSVVVSLRHSAIAFAFGDVLWAKYSLGEVFEIDDPAAKARAERNPQAGLITALQKRGVVFTVCGMALRRRAGEAAQRRGPGTSVEVIRDEWRAGLLPGVVEVAAGVIAVNRAQERGFSYVYAG